MILLALLLFLALGFLLGRQIQHRSAGEALRLAQRLRDRRELVWKRACNQALELAIAREQELLGVIRAQRAHITEFCGPLWAVTPERYDELQQLWLEAWRAAHEDEGEAPA